MHTIANMGSGDRLPIEGMIKSALDFFGSNFSGAFLAKQWRLCQEAYSLMIDDLEKAAEASKSQAWKDVQISWDDADLRQYGLFAALLLPALDKALNKAMLQQAKLELAKASIDIERYLPQKQGLPGKSGCSCSRLHRYHSSGPNVRNKLCLQTIVERQFRDLFGGEERKG
jgi:hypothetical protein